MIQKNKYTLEVLREREWEKKKKTNTNQLSSRIQMSSIQILRDILYLKDKIFMKKIDKGLREFKLFYFEINYH